MLHPFLTVTAVRNVILCTFTEAFIKPNTWIERLNTVLSTYFIKRKLLAY